MAVRNFIKITYHMITHKVKVFSLTITMDPSGEMHRYWPLYR